MKVYGSMLILGMKYNLFGSSLCCVAWDQSIPRPRPPPPCQPLQSQIDPPIPLPLASSDTHNLYDSQQQVDVTMRAPQRPLH